MNPFPSGMRLLLRANPLRADQGNVATTRNASRRITGMKRVHLNLCWGKVIAWALLVIGGAGAVAGYLFVLPHWESVRGAGPTAADSSRSARPTRPADDTLVLPRRVLRSLGIHSKKVTEARRPRTLPSLAGTLALDANRLVRV